MGTRGQGGLVKTTDLRPHLMAGGGRCGDVYRQSLRVHVGVRVWVNCTRGRLTAHMGCVCTVPPCCGWCNRSSLALRRLPLWCASNPISGPHFKPQSWQCCSCAFVDLQVSIVVRCAILALGTNLLTSLFLAAPMSAARTTPTNIEDTESGTTVLVGSSFFLRPQLSSLLTLWLSHARLASQNIRPTWRQPLMPVCTTHDCTARGSATLLPILPLDPCAPAQTRRPPQTRLGPRRLTAWPLPMLVCLSRRVAFHSPIRWKQPHTPNLS